MMHQEGEGGKVTDIATREMASLDFPSDMPVPLYTTQYGTVRVRGTRVSLDSVIHEYNQGRRPEEIVEAFDTLDLADVYAVISFYLHHRSQVDEYIRQGDEAFEAQRREAQSKPEYQAWVARLRERAATQL